MEQCKINIRFPAFFCFLYRLAIHCVSVVLEKYYTRERILRAIVLDNQFD
jgi:hypothetical protein